MVSIAQHIDRQKFDVTFVVAIDPETPPMLFEPEILSLDMHIIRICDLDGLKKKKAFFSALCSVFKQQQFDVVHANMDLLNGIVLSAAKKAGVPKRICHAHNTNTQYVSDSSPLPKKLLQKCYRRAMRALILRHSTVRLGCSDAANQYMYGSAEAQTMLNGIDLQRFFTAREQGDKAPDLRQAAVHLVTVGRISMQKHAVRKNLQRSVKQTAKPEKHTWNFFVRKIGKEVPFLSVNTLRKRIRASRSVPNYFAAPCRARPIFLQSINSFLKY